MTPAIVLEDVSVQLGGRQALAGVSLEVRSGEVLTLLGPSGSGKTSLLRAVTGFIAPTTGTVRLHGRVASCAGRILIPPEERGLAMVFQDLALWPHLTVYRNLSFGLEARSMNPTERAERIHDVLARVGLGAQAQSYPGQLSGGERQRVAIARALVVDPLAVLLDEPLSNLDLTLKDELLEMFRSLLHERRVPAIYVTHDPREAATLGDRIAVLDGGRIVQEGTLNTLCSEPANPFIRRLTKELLP